MAGSRTGTTVPEAMAFETEQEYGTHQGPDYPSPDRFQLSLTQAQDQMQSFRDRRKNWLRESVGRSYGTGDEVPRAINFIQQRLDTLGYNLAPQQPGATTDSPLFELGGYTAKLQAAIDHVCQEQDLENVLQDCVQDACLAPGCIVRVAYYDGGQSCLINDRRTRIGDIGIDRIDPDDFVQDPDARTSRELNWEGHYYRPKLAAVTAFDGYGLDDEELMPGEMRPPHLATRLEAMEILKKLSARTYTPQREGGAGQVENLTQETGRRFQAVDIVEMLDVLWYGYDQTWLLTAAVDESGRILGDKWLYAAPFEGPEAGAYIKMSFLRANNNAIGVPLATRWHDVHEAGVKVSRKAIDGMLRLKRVHAFSRRARNDAMRLQDAADGAWVAVDNAKDTQTIDEGGWATDIPLALQMLVGMFNQTGPGSPQQMAGRPQEGVDTATEAQILASQGAGIMQFLKGKVYIFVREILRAVGWYIHHHPTLSLTMPFTLPSNSKIMVRYSAADREGDWYDIAIDVKPGTMDLPLDGTMRTLRLAQFMEQTNRGLPLFQAGVFDWRRWIEIWASALSWRELARLVPDPIRQAEQIRMFSVGSQMAGALGVSGTPQVRGESMLASPTRQSTQNSQVQRTAAVQSAMSPRGAAA